MTETGGIKNTAEIIVEMAKLNAFDNLRFAGIVNVPPDTPFFPAAYHESSKTTFTIGLQTVQEMFDSTAGLNNLDEAKTKLLKSLNNIYPPVERLGKLLSKEIYIPCAGIDTSAAPMGDESIVYVIENISKVKFGENGTKDACRLITRISVSV